MRVEYDAGKNEKLKSQRGVGFDEVLEAIVQGGLLTVLAHPNPKKCSKQKVMLVRLGDYVYAVPYVERDEVLFLKTVFPSRKYTQIYLKK